MTTKSPSPNRQTKIRIYSLEVRVNEHRRRTCLIRTYFRFNREEALGLQSRWADDGMMTAPDQLADLCKLPLPDRKFYGISCEREINRVNT